MKEKISALVDGEIEIEDAGHVLVSLKTETRHAECWQTYHLIGDVMRGAPVLPPGFKQHVMRRLEAEPVVLAPQGGVPQAGKSAKSSVIWPMAASLAALAFVGWVVMQQQVQSGADVTPAEAAPMEIAQNIPAEYLRAHQSVTPNSAAYYIQSAGYTENGR